MILAAIQDRKARIEVGYGLESVLPDAVAGRILREQMFPLFKQGRYGDGVTAAVQEVARIAGGGQVNTPVAMRTVDQRVKYVNTIVRYLPLILIVGWIVFMPKGRASRYSLCRPYGRGGGFLAGGFSSGGGFGGFSGGCSGGGGASGGW